MLITMAKKTMATAKEIGNLFLDILLLEVLSRWELPLPWLALLLP
jgi:hypothetical protein